MSNCSGPRVSDVFRAVRCVTVCLILNASHRLGPAVLEAHCFGKQQGPQALHPTGRRRTNGGAEGGGGFGGAGGRRGEAGRGLRGRDSGQASDRFGRRRGELVAVGESSEMAGTGGTVNRVFTGSWVSVTETRRPELCKFGVPPDAAGKRNRACLSQLIVLHRAAGTSSTALVHDSVSSHSPDLNGKAQLPVQATQGPSERIPTSTYIFQELQVVGQRGRFLHSAAEELHPPV